MDDYHAILVDVSQKDKSIFNHLKILGKKEDGGWILYKIGITTNKLKDTIKELQDNLISPFYFHIYNEKELIVVFKEKTFRASPDKKSWTKIIAYGSSLNIPKEQLDFYPCKFKEETY
jgi:hypothetical protein